MSRFDDEGAPLITRTVTDRWNLPVPNIQSVLRMQSTALRLRWEALRKSAADGPPEAEPEDAEAPEAYGEHGERLHGAPTPHIRLEG